MEVWWRRSSRHSSGVDGSRSPGAPLALGVLRCLASALQPVLLALLHPRVAGQEAGLPKWHAVRVGVELEQRAGNTVTDRAGLTGHSATLDLDHRVEAALR